MFDEAASGRHFSNIEAEAEVNFWAAAVIALKERGYTYLTPEEVGNSAGGVGLFVRPDLLGRFQAYLHRQ
jgi:hypothetical protein